MYSPDKISTEEQLTGFLRCSIQDLPIITGKKEGVHPFMIPKRNRSRGHRTVYKISNYLISNVLKHLRDELSKLYQPKECVGGFVAGRNIAYNAKFHLDKNVVVNLDIKDFFESITHPTVVKMFKGLGFRKDIAQILADIVTYNKVIVAGFNTSPIIANMVCIEMDDELLSLCKQSGIDYTRYADDLSFSGEQVDILEEIADIIVRHGFTLNKDKTRIYKRGRAQYVTGLTVADSIIPRIPRYMKKSLRAAVYYIKECGLASHVEHKYGVDCTNPSLRDTWCRREASRVMGWIHYINGIEPIFAKKCFEMLEQVSEDEDKSYLENADLYVSDRR